MKKLVIVGAVAVLGGCAAAPQPGSPESYLLQQRYRQERQVEVVKATADDVPSWYAKPRREVAPETVVGWADEVVADRWGKKAATRVIGICRTGNDVEPIDPFEPGKPSEKTVRNVQAVPGAPRRASNLYDVSQSLSWVATRRNNAEQRIEWQTDIPWLIRKLQNFEQPVSLP